MGTKIKEFENGSYLEYDEAEGVYKYFEYGKPHLDGKTGEQLSFKNLLIQKVSFSQLDENGYLISNANIFSIEQEIILPDPTKLYFGLDYICFDKNIKFVYCGI